MENMRMETRKDSLRIAVEGGMSICLECCVVMDPPWFVFLESFNLMSDF